MKYLLDKMLILVAIVCLHMNASPSEAGEDTNIGIVSFTVDSLTSDFYVKRFPQFMKYRIPGTLYVQSQPVNTGDWGMDWDDLRDVDAQGWEIGAHSYSHEYHLTEVDDATLELELGAPAARFYRELGKYPKTFATPFGDYDERVLTFARIYYDAHLGAWGNGGINEFDSTDHYRINRIEMSNKSSVKEICSQIEDAGSKGYWLIFMLHTITEEEPGDYEISQQMFQGVLECAAALRDANRVQILTVEDALRQVPHTSK